ncbi:hypothetical protein [Rathayibacter sp. Leaf248]|nr:hypothetical protein [Rathayibacter sp. Leaf248]
MIRGQRPRCPLWGGGARRSRHWDEFVHFADPDGDTWALQQIVIPG